ncbi:MAG: hypothetical protein AAF996_04310 [Pseudomonadota bacterium]
MSVEFMMGKRLAGNAMFRSNAAEAVVSAINERLFESSDTLYQRTQLSDVSYRLRQAFSFEPEMLPQLPLQLGQNYHKASEYLEDAIQAWLEGETLADLFAYLRLDENTAMGVQELLVGSVHVQALSAWLCNEFGELRTSRQALHARRYVAVKLTREAMSAIRDAVTETEESPAQRQAQLDIWTDLDCPIQNSLHYRTVIAPVCNWLLLLESAQQAQVVGLRAANEEMPLVHTPMSPAVSPAASHVTGSAGSDFVDMSVLGKRARSAG